MDHAEIAMHGARGVQRVGACPGGVERARDFLADVGGLARARDADASGALMEEFDGLQEAGIQSIGDALERGRLAAHDLARVLETIIDGMKLKRHGSILALPQRFGALSVVYNDLARNCNGRAVSPFLINRQTEAKWSIFVEKRGIGAICVKVGKL